MVVTGSSQKVYDALQGRVSGIEVSNGRLGSISSVPLEVASVEKQTNISFEIKMHPIPF